MSTPPAHQKVQDAVDEIAAVREAIDAEIHQLEESLHSLRLHRNTLAPINKLPPEILIEIFMSIAAIPTSCGPPWRRVTEVCSHWREIAVGCSNLWTKIDFQSSGWEVYLSRTNAVPLTLDLQNSDAFDLFMGVFVENAHRVRECQLALPPPYFDRFLTRLEIIPSPMLEKLDLKGTQTDENDMPLFDKNVPSLRQLRLRNFKVPWTSPCLSGLTHLSISSEEKPELVDVLGTLELTGALRSLELYGGVPHCPAELHSTRLVSCRIIRLAHLSQLRLLDSSLSTSTHFVTHLEFPESVHIHITSRVSPNVLRLAQAVDSLAPHSSLNCYKLIVDVTSGIQITIQSLSEPLHYYRHISIHGIMAITRISQFFGEVFGKLIQLTCLDISVGKKLLKSGHWWKALCEMGHISDLRVRKSRKAVSLRELLQALELSKQLPNSSSQVLLPGLRRLHLIGLCTRAGAGVAVQSSSQHQTISKLLVPFLQTRRSRGVGIKELKITACDLGSRGDLGLIQQFVDVLDYDEETCDDCRRTTEGRDLDDDSSSDDGGNSSDNTDSSSDDTDSSSDDTQFLRRYVPFRGF